MFLDSKIGFLLLLTHFLAALIVGIIFRFYPIRISKKSNTENATKNNILSKKNKSSAGIKNTFQSTVSNIPSPLFKEKKRIAISELGNIMGEGIKNSISTLLLICGFLVFFCVLGCVLDKIGITYWISENLQSLFLYLGFSSDIAKKIACRFL